MPDAQTGKSYGDRMQSFVTDPDVIALDVKYEPYLEIHQMDDVLCGCDIIQNPVHETVTGRLVWNREYDLPIDLKREIIQLYNRHFVD